MAKSDTITVSKKAVAATAVALVAGLALGGGAVYAFSGPDDSTTAAPATSTATSAEAAETTASDSTAQSEETAANETTTPATETTEAAPAETASSACTVVIVEQNEWSDGFKLEFEVRAGDADIDAWEVTVDLATASATSDLWGAVLISNSDGVLTFANETYNGDLSAGTPATFGFEGNASLGDVTATCSA